MNGPLAQQVEHRTFNPQVPGSIPGRLTIITMTSFLFLASCIHFEHQRMPHVDGECPYGFGVKGNDSSNGFIYHTYESEYYDRVRAEICFDSEKSARNFGYRRFKTWRGF